MADIWTWDRLGRGTAAAAGCLALLLAGCTPPPPQNQVPATRATGGTSQSAPAPLSLVPATTAGTESGAAFGRPPGGPESQHLAATSPGLTGSGVPPGPTVTAYFVLLDDGGRHGVRFGCNDSLVGSPQESAAGDVRLKTAITAVLRAEQQPGNLYNALGTSRLRFLSGSFDGTTVTVYLAGTLNPGGACDLPRVEAQLTQTALEAAGALRANIYINGELLSDYLKPAKTEGNR